MASKTFAKEISGHKYMKSVPGGPAAVAGVTANGIHCGLKPNGASDLALFVSEQPCKTAAFFTQNKLLGAHIPVFREKLKATDGLCRALLVNSKCANCATGRAGIDDNLELSFELTKKINVPPNMTLMASTGVIGERLKKDKILGGMDNLVKGLKSGSAGGGAASRAIMTTDTHPKICAVQVAEGRNTYTIGGVAKGAGMIAPNLATMFSFIFTDADVPSRQLKKIAAAVVDDTYNCISVDGDTSPNDTVMVMANGMSGVKVNSSKAALGRFAEALDTVARWLCMEIVRDGEGATKLVHIEIRGAKNREDAVKMANSIGNSNLVKTAIFGQDPNWGRIVSAAGVSGAEFDPYKTTLTIDGVKVYDKGRLPALKKKIMNNKDIYIRMDAGLGRGEARFWTCDLSYDYVKINAEYTT